MAPIDGSHLLVQALIDCGVDVLFGYPGGAIMPIYDALYTHHERIRHISVRHEQGAIHAAEGYARVKGRAGVCMATSGPGATNLITGLADALMDSIPLVCITGQVNSKFLGTDAFQETDVIGVAIPVTKWCYQITDAAEVPYIIHKAFEVARSGRPGPVLIDITKDAQFAKVETPKMFITQATSSFAKATADKKVASPTPSLDIKAAAELLNNAKRPYMLVGHGVVISGATSAAVEVAERASIPMAATLHALAAIPNDHPLYVGMLGMHGNYGPDILTNEADVILAVGMRFDDRVTGDVNKYAKNAKIIHIEVDPAEVNKCVEATVPLIGDAKDILSKLLPLLTQQEHPGWLEQFHSLAQREHAAVIHEELDGGAGALKMGEVIKAVASIADDNAVIIADVGQHQMATARYFGFKNDQSWISSGGLGTMGFALPAALGAAVADPTRQVIAVIGDGGFQMTLQELGTLAQEGLAIKIIILNNNFLGMVRQWQELFFEKRYSFVDMTNPDFLKLADAYGIPGFTVSERENLPQTLTKFFSTKGPGLLEVVVEKEQNVFPMIPAGAGVGEMILGDEL